MDHPFLDVFPREIRDLIYTFVLASPSGEVTLSPWTIEVARSLELLRTCRQIHRECKTIIWKHNRLRLADAPQLSHRINALRGNPNFQQTQHLRIFLEILDRDELQWFLGSVPALLEWCQKGKLSSITLISSWLRPSGPAEFREMANLRKYGLSVDGRLYLEPPRDEATKTTITTGWPGFTHWGKQSWLKVMLMDSNGIEELLEKIHRAFGGQMFVGGHLSFENNTSLRKCVLDPLDGEVQIFPNLRPVRLVGKSVEPIPFAHTLDYQEPRLDSSPSTQQGHSSSTMPNTHRRRLRSRR